MSKKQQTPPPNDDKQQGDAAAQATADQPQESQGGDQLQFQLEAARAESTKNLEGWQRTLAEFQNYKRRVERESKETYQNGSIDFLTKLLPVIDDFDRALASIPEDVKGNPWLEGVLLIQRKFNKVLEDYQVTEIDPVGQQFDPNMHQAIGRDEDSGLESGTVTVTLQKGYMAGDRVLRPAIVKVAS